MSGEISDSDITASLFPCEDTVRVLLVEDSPDYAALVRSSLDRAGKRHFEVQHAAELSAAMTCLEEQSYDALLLDLSLPDSDSVLTLSSACSFAADLPILVLTGSDDTSLAMAAVEAGAQDYLIKDRVERLAIPGMILRAIERHREKTCQVISQSEPQGVHVAVRDGLTGLPNAILFEDRVACAIRQAERGHESFGVMILELDIAGAPHESAESQIADDALRRAARAMRSWVGPRDTLARVSPTGFGVILHGDRASDDLDFGRRVESLFECLTAVPEAGARDPEGPIITASIGLAICPEDGDTLEALLENAQVAESTTARIG